MKLARYLQKIDGTHFCDIEAFIELSRQVDANREKLTSESRDLLTELLAERVIEAKRELQAREVKVRYQYNYAPGITPYTST